MCKAAIAKNIISEASGGSFQLKKYKSDIGPIQSSYSNIQANEILGKSWKAQSIFFDFKDDSKCVPELIQNIKKESDQYDNSNVFGDVYNSANVTWISDVDSLKVEFETVHQLSRLVIEPVQGHNFIQMFTLEAFDSSAVIKNLTFGNSSVYR